MIESIKQHSATIIAVLSFFVSLISLSVAMKANKITSDQTKIMRANSATHMIVNIVPVRNEEGFVAEKKIDISFEGPPPMNPTTKVVSFITMRKKEEVIRIPLIGYYFATHTHDAKNQKLALIEAHENNLKGFNLINALDALAKKRGIEYPLPDIRSYLLISYTNSLDNHVEEYFDVSHITATELSAEEGAAHFEFFENSIRAMLMFDIDSDSVSKFEKLLEI